MANVFLKKRKIESLKHSLTDTQLIDRTRQSIQEDFSLAPSELENTDAWESLEKHVARIVSYMMDQNMGEFLNMLYIMDVSEDKIKRAIYDSESEEVSLAVAAIIIEREKQKVITRAVYQETHGHEKGDF